MKHNAVEHARKSRKSDRCASHKGEEVVAAGGAEVWMRQMEILDLAGNLAMYPESESGDSGEWSPTTGEAAGVHNQLMHTILEARLKS